MKRLQENSPLIIERNQSNGEIAMCTGCKGFYSAKYLERHKRKCSHVCEDVTFSSILNEDIESCPS